LLAYYIAAVNIETAFHDQMTESAGDFESTADYLPFEGICLTDTFQLGESDGSDKMFSEMFPQNSDRVVAQKKAPLRVIIGNPPYSVGQRNANDNAGNQEYITLNNRISQTYAANSDANNKNSLYDSYIKAFRWASDRLDKKNGGVIAFISNNGWIDKGVMAGFRKSLESEFSSIYTYDLRGAIRGRSGDNSKREGQNVFDIMTGVAITILVKKPDSSEKANIYYNDIGDYLSKKEKLTIIKMGGSLCSPRMSWITLQPDEHSDWLSKRNGSFGLFLPIAPEVKFNLKDKSFFITYSCGVQTNRDAWVYNFSKEKAGQNISQMIDFYNDQTVLLRNSLKSNPRLIIEEFLEKDERKIKWSSSLLGKISKFKHLTYNKNQLVKSTYRPFTKSNLYFDASLNHRPYQIPKLFPQNGSENLLICISGSGFRKDFALMITKEIPDLEIVEKSQCFPLYYYEERPKQQRSLFDEGGDSEYIRRDGVSDFILERAKKQYGKNVIKEDIFYYVYGFLHSPQYREKFANDLKKMLPRLPLVEDVRDFWAFSKAGRKLAELHINYESVPAFPGVEVAKSSDDSKSSDDYKVTKMRFPKKDQKDTIIYNSKITVSNIPAKAYEYIVNGKSAIEWIMERYQITTHKESGIRNDPNDWATEVDKPSYILDLLLSIINVSVQTVDIVAGLPKVSFE